MKYDQFTEVLATFPSGRYIVNSFQLRNILSHAHCKKVSVRVLHIGTLDLDMNDVIDRLASHSHPRMDNIKITCLDGEVIIDEPYLGH
ncbi:hypothetical protein QWY82_12875 [Simiduia curdlanivorans]|uniref:Uncharacterized protein n=1 Tax=Simiduia curdlanivorans TaxID=1492769 RepID=A0ABV8V7U1_9GAMM|nr:hypothetical protein [Simiduia curdlanivorans]MDN3639691.1 hypothetical protein [Simiduia curdlanivorans]